MKKVLSFVMLLVLVLSLAACSQTESKKEETTSSEMETKETAFEPTKNVEFVVSSSPGGGSDIFSRNISDIMTKNGLVSQSIMVNNQADGGGEVSRRRVSGLKNEAHTLLSFNTGDLQAMLTNTKLRLENLTPLAVMALDGQVLLVNNDSEYQTIEDVIKALEAGTEFMVGGSKSDDEHVYSLFKQFIGKDKVEYLRFDSTGDALTSLLGGHVDIAIGKPAASLQYIESGDMKAIATFGTERFEGVFSEAPTFIELGYEDIQFEIYRGVVGPGDMPQEAVDYWVSVLKEVSESPEWKTNYIEKFKLIPSYIGGESAREYMQKVEDEILSSN